MALKIHHEPAQEDRPASESSHGNQVNSPILGGERVVDGYQDSKAGNRQYDAESKKRGAKAQAIREISDYDG